MKYNDLFGYAVFTFTLHLNVRAENGVACKDQQGQSYESGFHYIPGPEACTICVCDNGNPKWCKAFICKFPEGDCKSFRRGDRCCEFICLDDTLSSMSNEKTDGTGGTATDGTANYDIGLRSVASFVTAVLSLSLLFFLIHRLRQRKIRGRQSRQLAEDQRNLGSMGYLERDGLSHGVPMDDIPCGANYPLWKPAGNYFPRGEAPPPYEEAVAAARAEQALLSMSPHTLPQLNFPNNYLPSGNGHASVSLLAAGQPSIGTTPASPLTETTTASAASAGSVASGTASSPLISTSSRPVSNPNIYASYRQSNVTPEAASPGLDMGTSTTSFTIRTTTYENLPTPLGIPKFNNQHPGTGNGQPVSSSQSGVSKGYQPHTTLPRQSGAFTISASLPNSTVATHRTIPRTLPTRTGARLREATGDHSLNQFLRLSPNSNLPVHPLSHPPLNHPLPHSLSHSSPHSGPQSVLPNAQLKQENASSSQPSSEDVAVRIPSPRVSPCPSPSTCLSSSSSIAQQPDVVRQHLDLKTEKSRGPDFKPALNLANEINEEGSFESVACTCSMQALPTLHDDTDDYRSECENCKSASGSRYYLDNENELVTSPHVTMTLHRRPDETASSTTPQYYRTSLTLPISTRQRTRSTSVRENWFNTMPQCSTESSDEN